MYPDGVHHAVHHREVGKWGKMGKDVGGKMGRKWKNGARWEKMRKDMGGKRELNVDVRFFLLFCVAHSFLLRSRTSSKLVGDGHGYCVVPSPLLATMEHLVTDKGIKYIPMKVTTDPQRKWVTASWFPKPSNQVEQHEENDGVRFWYIRERCPRSTAWPTPWGFHDFRGCHIIATSKCTQRS